MTGFDLRLWRKSQGWTQAQAALAMGCGERSWRRYEESGPPVMLERAIISMELKWSLSRFAMLDKEQILQYLDASLHDVPARARCG